VIDYDATERHRDVEEYNQLPTYPLACRDLLEPHTWISTTTARTSSTSTCVTVRVKRTAIKNTEDGERIVALSD
jgi:hypothetical protein